MTAVAAARIDGERQTLESIMEAANDALLIIDERGLIEGCNQSALNLFGYERFELLGRNVAILMPEPVRSRHDGYIRAYLETREPHILGVRAREVDAVRKDGTLIPVELVVSELYIASRRIFMGAIRDISDRKRALRQSEEARDQTAAILRAVADGLVVTNVEGGIVLLNPAAEAVLGAPGASVIGKSLHETVQNEALREHTRLTHASAEAGAAIDFALSDHVFQAKSSPIIGRDGRCQGFVTSIRDVTREREIDRLKTDFISTAAHELRTPLTSIQGFSEILLSRGNLTAAETEKFLRYINSQAQHLAHIVADLLDLSRIEAGAGLELEPEHFDLGELAAEIVAMLRPMSKLHRFAHEFDPTPPRFRADRAKLAQVLENIVGNAIKYSPSGGLISLRGSAVVRGYRISVSDHGIGMSPEQVRRMSQRFWRADASNTAIEGTGLGMAIVEALVEAHRGSVDVTSAIGKGTTVGIFLPAEEEDA